MTAGFQKIGTIQTSREAVYSLALSADNALLAVGQRADDDSGLALGIWSLGERRLSIPIISDPHAITEAVRFSPDGSILAYTDENQDIRLQNLRTHTVATLESRYTRWIDFARDRNRILTTGERSVVWDVNSHEMIWILSSEPYPRGAPGRGRVGALSPDGCRAAVAGVERGIIVIYDVDNGSVALRLEGAMDAARYLAFDGRHVGAVEESSHGICLWKADTGERILVDLFNLETEAYWSLAFHPSGKFVAAGSRSGYFYIVRLEDGEFVVDDPTHRGGVNDLCFSRDGRLLVTGGDDGIVTIWEFTD